MSELREYLALRTCLFPPIRELHEAAELLGEAADALLAGDHELARDRLGIADMPTLHAYASRIMGRVDKEIHRYRRVDGLTATTTLLMRAEPRMPNSLVERAIYKRDGYHCRFCECRARKGTERDESVRSVVDSMGQDE
jgi:hypothetical protein